MLGDGQGVTLGDALKGATVTATVKSAMVAPTRCASSSSAAASTTRSKMGHRQHYTEIEITGINA